MTISSSGMVSRVRLPNLYCLYCESERVPLDNRSIPHPCPCCVCFGNLDERLKSLKPEPDPSPGPCSLIAACSKTVLPPVFFFCLFFSFSHGPHGRYGRPTCTNSCMDYDEYDASTSSAPSSLVATINTYCSWGLELGSIWYVLSESCQAATQMQTWPFSAFFLISPSSSGTYKRTCTFVPTTICRAAGLLWIAAAGSDCPTIPSNWIHLLRSCIGTVRSGRYVHSSQVQRTEQKTRSYLVAGNLP